MYVVIENTPGYLPDDDDPYVTESLEDAKAVLRELVERHTEWCEDVDMTYNVWFADDGMSASVANRSGFTYDLGRAFEIHETEERES